MGIRHPNKRGPTRIFELNLCQPGEPIDLVPEPKNPADPNAIAIFSCRGVQLGYVTAERAPLILSYMRTGREVRAVFQGVSVTGPWVRVAFDGEEPVAKPASGSVRTADAAGDHDSANDSGFWPDPIFDDE